MGRLRAIDDLVAGFVQASSLRARSLIVSVFGDVVAVHGNSVWLGSLIGALAPLGLNERQLRTAVFRLVGDGWLQSTRLGRRSFYGFTRTGIRHYETAAERIYAGDSAPWDGRWTLVMIPLLDTGERELVRRELKWLGFGPLGQGVLGHPSADSGSLERTLADLGLSEKVAVMHAAAGDDLSGRVIAEIAQDAFELDAVADAYAAFIERFTPVHKAIGRARALDDEQCFLVRILVIHEYRRIMLADADLPESLLPQGWPGGAARRLTVALYRAVAPATERYVRAHFENEAGPLPPPQRRFHERFGGLDGVAR